MRGKLLFLFAVVVFLAATMKLRAEEILVPAGTLLHCTLDEPNLSSKTVQIGDPLICHASSLYAFGRPVFQRGAYLAGRLVDYRDPGHFFGKGWIQLQFDRVVLPNSSVSVPARMVSVHGFKVDREGRILGKGHPRRDAIEWAIPVLWPLKLITLPMRGPRPALKGETSVELRLLDDVYVPVAPTAVSWLMPSRPEPGRSASNPPNRFRTLRYGGAVQPGAQAELSALGRPSELYTQVPMLSTETLDRGPTASTTYTLLVLTDRSVRAVADYWLQDGRIFYVAPNGAEDSVALSELDWKTTQALNAQLGITFLLRLGREKANN